MALLNPVPFPAQVTVTLGGEVHKAALDPFGLVAIRKQGAPAPEVRGKAPPAYVARLKARLDEMEKLIIEVENGAPVSAMTTKRPAAIATIVRRIGGKVDPPSW